MKSYPLPPYYRLVTLNDELLLKISKCDALANITVLNLHGNGLTKLKNLQSLSALRKLIVPFNELTRLEDLAHMVTNKAMFWTNGCAYGLQPLYFSFLHLLSK